MIHRFSILAYAVLAAGWATASDSAAAQPAPLTKPQVESIRRLVSETQSTSSALQRRLTDQQRQLAALYADYELNEAKANELEDSIVDLQRQRLANYRRMQVELRKIVGKERFLLLKRRIDRVLETPPDSQRRKPNAEQAPKRQPQSQS